MRESAAASELYDRYAPRIYRFCLARLRSREEAEDATQITFLNAFRSLSRGVTPELEQAWLYKIAENVCLSRLRSNVRRFRVESPTDLEPLHESVAAPVTETVDLEVLQDALARLPDQQRRAILLREWQGLSYAEIASELGISQSAVETLIFRARRSLAKGLRDEEKNGVLRKLANAGTVVGWLKSILLGGSTAAKIAAVAAAGAAVVAGTATEVATYRHAAAPTIGAQAIPAPAAVTLVRPVLHRPLVIGDPVGRKAQPMRLAPVARNVQQPARGSVRTPVYSSGRRESNDSIQHGSRRPAPGEHSAPTPVSAPASEEAKAPEAEEPEAARPKPEHPVVPGPNDYAAPPATTHPGPPVPVAGPKDKAPDDSKPDEPADGKKK